ncbi:MAG: glycosyltransferase family 39 protein [Candidatus Hydrogenedentes bacterium]|nr:glycosyltransferase family 39 protein [Candidatus Hydrogenedentota bacterium]
MFSAMFRSFTAQRPGPVVLVCLAAITLTGAAMRLYGLSNQSLWFDEVCSWHTATQPTLAGVWSGDIAWNMYPPLYGFVLRAAAVLFGTAEWALRLPSALAGIAAIPLIYLAAARVYGDIEGLLSSGFAAFLMFPLYFAQEARPYALLLCSVLAAVLAWTYVYPAWREGRRAPRAALTVYFAASVCAAYLHYFGLLFVALHGMTTFALLARNRFGLVRATGFYAATALAFAPWLPYMAWHLTHQSEGPQNPPPDANIAVSLWQYVESLFNHGQTGQPFAPLVTAVAFLLMVLALMHDLVTPKGNKDGDTPRAQRPRAAVLLAWLLLPFLIAYVKSAVSASVFTHRNLIISLPIVYMLVARGLARSPFPRPVVAGMCAVILLACCARTLASGYYTAPHKDQLREAVAVVKANETNYPDAALVVYSHLPFVFDYYLQRFGSTLRPERVAGKAEHIDAMRAFVRDRKPAALWYLCTNANPEDAFVDYLNAEFTVVGLHRFLRADAMLLVPK